MTITHIDQAIEIIYSYIKRKAVLDTERPTRVLAVLNATGNPQEKLKIIHVAGTKGKGSTCAMLAAALKANRYRVGLYTSPHLHDLRERVQINGNPIPPQDLIDCVTALNPYFTQVEGIGFPEVMTCIALHYFARVGVDIAVIETHLGGRYDATNVITPVCSVITTIDYDHTDILGNSLAKIAYHKAGIIKPRVAVVSTPQPPEALNVIYTEAQQKHAPLHVIGTDSTLTLALPTPQGQHIRLDGRSFHTNLIGRHQGVNLAVTLKALHQSAIPINGTQTQTGLDNVQWGGRFEVIQLQPPLILDIAHNVAAAVVLRDTLDTLYPTTKRIFVYGSKANKDVSGILSVLVQQTDQLILTKVDDPPTSPPEELAIAAHTAGVKNVQMVNNVTRALQRAMELTSTNALVCVTGSIFVVAAARSPLV